MSFKALVESPIIGPQQLLETVTPKVSLVTFLVLLFVAKLSTAFEV